jgi:hypothetical protein
MSRSPVAFPEMSNRTSARIGIPSLAKTFQIPDTRIESVTDGIENPQDMSIAYVAPTPSAPPNGITFETALPAKFTHSACRTRRPGSVLMSTPV